MSYPVKLTLFLLAFNIIGFAEGYFLAGLSLYWLVPLILATAFAAVLVSRRWLTRDNR
jgi:membrane protein implicated in regulation of membrane protease activity